MKHSDLTQMTIAKRGLMLAKKMRKSKLTRQTRKPRNNFRRS